MEPAHYLSYQESLSYDSGRPLMAAAPWARFRIYQRGVRVSGGAWCWRS